ncbi:MAG: metallophosphoesterase [Nanoarchaeota archaeon]|nr:metallophosphoesterase [Nanoarchaeota archaeon]
MKVAVISDIHDNFHNLVLALEKISELKAEKILFLGDFVNGGIAKVLAASEIPVFAIWGNNDGSKVSITKTSLVPGSALEMSLETYDIIEIDGRKIFLTHYPLLAKSMAKSGDYDAVFYGHDHKKNKDKINDCLIINPGEISAHKTNGASFALYDTKTNDAEMIMLEDYISVKTEKVHQHLKKLKLEFSKTKFHQY